MSRFARQPELEPELGRGASCGRRGSGRGIRGGVVLGVFLLICGGLGAQGVVPAGWFSLAGDVGLPGPFELGVELCHRRESGWADNSFAEVTLGWKLDKHWDVGLGYRFAAADELRAIGGLSHRYNLDLEFDENFGEWKVKARLRHQWKHTDLLWGELGWLPERESRVKLSVGREVVKHWKAETGGELFMAHGIAAGAAAGTLQSYRVFAGVEHELNKWLEVDVKVIGEAKFGLPLPTAITSLALKSDLDKMAKAIRKKRSKSA